MTGYQENVSVSEGFIDGVETILHFEGDSLITQKRYDATPHLDYAKHARDSTDGKRWGEGKLVGHIPPAEYAKFLTIKGNDERQKAIKGWLRANPAFVMFDKYLKR